MVHKNTTGFTLIEVVLVLAISASLSLIAFQGFSTARGRAEFTNSIDTLKEQVTAVRTEAYTTVNISGTGASATVELGRMIKIKKAAPGNQLLIYRIIANNSDSNTATLSLILDRTITVPYGIKYVGVDNIVNIAFVRRAIDGANVTTVDLGTWPVLPTYSQLMTSSAAKSILFQDPNGLKATIDINPAANSIGRTFL